MEQHFYSPVEQVAGKDIYNIYIHLKNKDVDISDLSLADMLSTVEYVKQENKKIIKMKYINVPCLSIFLVILLLSCLTFGNLYILVSKGITNGHPIFSGNTLIIIIMSCFVLISVLGRFLHKKTKYLHPILTENNDIIYELELEIQKRKLRGEI